jgi:hypothetical protein
MGLGTGTGTGTCGGFFGTRQAFIIFLILILLLLGTMGGVCAGV